MTVLELSFPAGRYHATPWGRHVNEGAVEWPPSPWRIARALIATWYLKAREIPESTVRSLVGSLSAPPMFRLPRATTAHTRHYMPYNEGKNERTTKVFDTFIQIAESGTLLVAWAADLSDAERSALHTLAARLSYLGRAESLVMARLLEGVTGIEANSIPLLEGAALPERTEMIRLLAPISPDNYAAWRTDFTAKAEAALGPKPTAAQKKKLPKVPKDLFAALHAGTGDLQSAGWNLPPGAEFRNYTRPENAFAPATRPSRLRKGPLPTVARFAVVSAVAPRIIQGVSIGDRVHDALCKWSDQGKGRAAVFTGLDENGKPRANHQHAHIFCEANGPRDAVTHITVWAPMGFDEEACVALRRLNKVWGYGGHDLRLVLHGLGQSADFPDCALFGPIQGERKAKVWRSITPFISTRHPKTFRDGRPKLDADGWPIGSPAHDLRRLLAEAGMPAPTRIEPLDTIAVGSRRLRLLEFQSQRFHGKGARGVQVGAAFKLTFPTPVSGPIALGYAAHFGLGLFVPMD